MVRRTIFRHLVGLAIVPLVAALYEVGVAQLLMVRSNGIERGDIIRLTGARPCYLAIALRALISCGCLDQRVQGEQVFYTCTAQGRALLGLASLFVDMVRALPTVSVLERLLEERGGTEAAEQIQHWADQALWARSAEGVDISGALSDALRGLLDGMFVALAMVALKRRGLLDAMGVERGGLSLNDDKVEGHLLETLTGMLGRCGWAYREGRVMRLTAQGRYAADLAGAYGVTVSYAPLLARLSSLLSGEREVSSVHAGLLVDRALNIWGSGEAHKGYFKQCGDLVANAFNSSLSEQPLGICDMGCGDGSLLKYLYEVVRCRSLRGKAFDSMPLLVIGADSSSVAREIARERLARASIPNAIVVPGDVSDPDGLARELFASGIAVDRILHVRSFLDHNRPIVLSEVPPRHPNLTSPRTTAAHALDGNEVAPEAIESSLVQHFARWAPYARRFGLVIAELHTLSPESIRRDPFGTPCVAYDITHGFSNQFLVEYEVFVRCAAMADLRLDCQSSSCIPGPEQPMISVSRFH